MESLIFGGAVVADIAAFFNVSVLIATLLVLAYAVWTVIWKGVALWHAARNMQYRWFIALLVLSIPFALLEIAYLLWFRRDRQPGVTQSLFNNPVRKEELERVEKTEAA